MSTAERVKVAPRRSSEKIGVNYFATRRIRLSDDSMQNFSVDGLYALPFTS